MTFKRIDKSRRFEQVSLQLRKSIFGGKYQPGQRLPNERDLAETFDTSRIIVREAIWDLKKSGLVEVKRGAHGGAFVQGMRHDALAAERATKEDLVEMHQYLETIPKKQTDEYVHWQIGFHRRVANASQNPLLAMQVNIFLDFSEDMVLNLRQKDRLYHDIIAHPAILEKISQRDADGAKRLFYDHLLEIKPVFDDWEKNFGNNGLVASKSRRREQL
jgi:DNA-binding FadR family transcriptional regulator